MLYCIWLNLLPAMPEFSIFLVHHPLAPPQKKVRRKFILEFILTEYQERFFHKMRANTFTLMYDICIF